MSVLKKKIAFIAQRFLKLLSPKNMVTWMPENSCLRRHFCSPCVKWSETLLKCARQHFYAISKLIWNKLSCVSCLLVWCETVRPFFDMLTVDHKHSFHNYQKFSQKVQQQLSSNPKTIFASFIAFLKCTWNFERFLKRDHFQSSNIFEVIEFEKFGYLNARKVFLQNTFPKSTC